MKNTYGEDVWGTHALENMSALTWGGNHFLPLFGKIEETITKSKNPYEVRAASFWLYKLGQWFPDYFFLPDLVSLSIKRLKVSLEDESIDLHVKNAIKEDIFQLERFKKELKGL